MLSVLGLLEIKLPLDSVCLSLGLSVVCQSVDLLATEHFFSDAQHCIINIFRHSVCPVPSIFGSDTLSLQLLQ